MKAWREVFTLLSLSVIAAVGTHFFHPRAPSWYLDSGPPAEDEVTIAEVDMKWKGDVLWIDARSRALYEKHHVPGAVLINEQERDQLLFDNISLLQDNKKPIVVYCDSGACQASRKIREHLKYNMAIDQIFVLHGGWDSLRGSRFLKAQK